MNIKYKKFDKTLPDIELKNMAAGFDFYCRLDVSIEPGKIGVVPLNNAIEIPEGFVILLFSRSGTPSKKGLVLANGVGVWDPFYRGNDEEAVAQLMNITDKVVEIKKGERLIQGVLLRYETPIFKEVKN
ncbi:MAG: dUTP diphosphatase [Candidatus Dojkabacteria bacterium]|nr:dUTP diphosphatase [Candidatus Dojkabacteria bacterium]MDQ7020926.1 dUTP diphosphatase [Candidatus Dojkabacteria bacterium]